MQRLENNGLIAVDDEVNVAVPAPIVEPAIAEIQIPVGLSPNLTQIARALKELKETSIRISQGSKKLLPLLRRAIVRADDKHYKLVKGAISHYEKLAATPDAWPEITTDSLKDEDSIIQLFLAVEKRLNTREAFEGLESRQECYIWVSANVTRLNAFLSKQEFTQEEKNVISDNLISPAQRLPKLELFTKGFKNEAEQGQHNELQQVLERLIYKIKRINDYINDLLSYHPDLIKLKRKIDKLDNGDELKLPLEHLFKQLDAEIKLKQGKKFSEEKIQRSSAMLLCHYTTDMLDVGLNPNSKLADKNRAFKKYQNATTPSMFLPYLKFIAAVLIAAVVTAVVTAAVTGMCAILGTLVGGPVGMVAGGVAGLIQGSVTGAGVGVMVASAVTGVTVGAYCGSRMFKHDPKVDMAKDVLNKAVKKAGMVAVF